MAIFTAVSMFKIRITYFQKTNTVTNSSEQPTIAITFTTSNHYLKQHQWNWFVPWQR